MTQPADLNTMNLKLKTLSITEKSKEENDASKHHDQHPQNERSLFSGAFPKTSSYKPAPACFNSQNTLIDLQKELQKKKIVLKTAKLNLLPDGGERLKTQIANLESQIETLQSKENINRNISMPSKVSQKQYHPDLHPNQLIDQKHSSNRFFQVRGPNGETTLVKVKTDLNQKPDGVNLPRQTSDHLNNVKDPATTNKIYQLVPSIQGNYIPLSSEKHLSIKHDEKIEQQLKPKQLQYQPSIGTIQIPAQPLPSHVQKEMYEKKLTAMKNQFSLLTHPHTQTLYGGRMTEAQKREAKLITGEAIEKLHHSLQTCPPETEKETDPEGLKVSLLPHQKHALKWMLWRESQDPSGGILADDMGLGKTLTALSLILKSQQLEPSANVNVEEYKNLILIKATLIICPASVLHQWAKESEQRIIHGKQKVCLFHGPNRETNPKKFLNYDIVLTTYNIIISEIGGESKDTSKDSGSSTNETLNSPRKRMGTSFLDVIWERIILDEAHTIKNPKSQTSVAICKLRAKHRWAITGTPINNDLMDMYSLLRFLRCSPFDELKVWKKWVDNKSIDGQKRMNTLIKSLMLRRTKNQMGETGKPLINLPSKEMETIAIELSQQEQDIYRQIYEVSRKTLMNYLNNQQKKKDGTMEHQNLGVNSKQMPIAIRSSDILVNILRLRQCCSHLNLIKNNIDVETRQSENIDDNLLEQFSGMSLNESKSTTEPKGLKSLITQLSTDNPIFEKSYPSTKIKNLLSKLKEVHSHSHDTGAKIKSVIVSQWTSMLEIIEYHLKNANFRCHIIKGDIPPKKRATEVDEFNNNPEGPEIMLVSLRAGGVGLNLIGGSHLFLVDMHWNPQLELQACDRIHRVGQKYNVHIHRFLCQNTVEESILALQERKLKLASNVYAGVKDKMQKLTLEDIKMLFNLRQPNKSLN